MESAGGERLLQPYLWVAGLDGLFEGEGEVRAGISDGDWEGRGDAGQVQRLLIVIELKFTD